MYFNSQKLHEIFIARRKSYIELTIDKADGTESILEGVLCLSAKAVWMVNSGDIKSPVWRTIPMRRVKSIFHAGVSFGPAEEIPQVLDQVNKEFKPPKSKLGQILEILKG